MYIYMYIYIYVCVCVCMGGRVGCHHWFTPPPPDRKQKRSCNVDSRFRRNLSERPDIVFWERRDRR